MRGILLVTLALCVLVGYAASRMIAEPLKVVTEALERVAARDLTASVEVTSSDEFGRLSNALNTSVAAMREVLQLMRQGSGTVTAAARELSDHAHRNKDNSEAQTGKINQIATAAHQVTQTISEISLNIESAATASQESADAAEKGNLVMQSAAQTMGKIAEVTSAVHEKISSLVDRSREIGEVVQMIQEISEQTHMLAFNAAIEAARGGEHGTGFVVVANHVRHLAESTKTATGEIAATISGIQRETNDTLEAIASSRSTVEAGLSETAEARESLETVITSSRDLGKKIYVIRTAATEQTAASAEISESARNIAQLANENSHATNDGAKAANRLSDLAHQLDGIIGQFKISSNQVAAAH
jgi:methyl-accepting chemotaxis protein